METRIRSNGVWKQNADGLHALLGKGVGGDIHLRRLYCHCRRPQKEMALELWTVDLLLFTKVKEHRYHKSTSHILGLLSSYMSSK